MTHRFFRINNEIIYEQIRLDLDAEWGNFPPVTCIDPYNVAPRDDTGRIVLAVKQSFIEFPAAATLLSKFLKSGEIEEIDIQTYMTAILPPETIN